MDFQGYKLRAEIYERSLDVPTYIQFFCWGRAFCECAVESKTEAVRKLCHKTLSFSFKIWLWLTWTQRGFFASTPAGQEYFKQSDTRLHFIAEKAGSAWARSCSESSGHDRRRFAAPSAARGLHVLHRDLRRPMAGQACKDLLVRPIFAMAINHDDVPVNRRPLGIGAASRRIWCADRDVCTFCAGLSIGRRLQPRRSPVM